MICFTIPYTRLRPFLVALNMNYDMPEPDYIFQIDKTFQIVYTKTIDPDKIKQIDDLIGDNGWEVFPN